MNIQTENLIEALRQNLITFEEYLNICSQKETAEVAAQEKSITSKYSTKQNDTTQCRAQRYLALCLLFITGLLFSQPSFSWYCDQVSSEKNGNVISACGIATGKTEDIARTEAFDNAKTEFKKICDNSSDCKSYQTTVSPERSECLKVDGQYKCTRLIVFTISKKQKLAAQIEKPLAKIGMKIRDFIEKFGKPKQVIGSNNSPGYYYSSESFCAGASCTVWFEDGKLNSFTDFDASYQEL